MLGKHLANLGGGGFGDPVLTVFPEQVDEVLQKLQPYDFPIIEMQTNGITIAEGKITDDNLEYWHRLGLRTIAISNVGIDAELNRQVYLPYRKRYIDLAALIERLHRFGFSVRLATVMINPNGINTFDKVVELSAWAQMNKVEQVSIRPVTRPNMNKIERARFASLSILGKQSPSYYAEQKEGREATEWIEQNALTQSEIYAITEQLASEGTLLMKLPHGADVYDLYGQNVCFTNCLTHDTDPNAIRQLIYFPDSSIRYSWEYTGARIL